MHQVSDRRKVLVCLSPVLGITAGFVIGFFVYWVIPENPDTVVQLAAKFYTLTFSLICWSISVVLGQHKRLICGGGE
jgi:hypothetical protein